MNLKEKASITKSKLIALLLVLMLATAVLTSAFTYIVLSNPPNTNLALDIEIQPRDAKLVVGQIRKFWVIVHNGSSPYVAEWYSNGTSIGSGLTVDFSFSKRCAYTVLSVLVEDSRGNVGYDETRVYDPTYITSGSFTDDYSYLISYKNSTHIQAKNGSTGSIQYSGTSFSTILQSCLDTGSGLFFIRGGSYTVDDTILYTYNDTYIQGEGIANTILTFANNVNKDMFNITNKDFVGLSDLRINGNKAQQSSGNGIRIYSTVDAVAWSSYYFDNVQVFNFKENGIYSGGSYPGGETRYADKAFITKCIISQNDGAGVKIENYGYEWKIIGNTIDRNAQSGIWLVGSSEHLIQGNHIWQNQHGITLYSNATHTVEIGINEITTSDMHGMYIYGDTTNNGPANLTITGNTVTANSQSGAGSYSGIYIANSTWLLITGNHLSDRQASPTQGWGLEEVSGDYNVIVANIAVGNTVGGITKTGANTKVNFCYNGTSWIS